MANECSYHSRCYCCQHYVYPCYVCNVQSVKSQVIIIDQSGSKPDDVGEADKEGEQHRKAYEVGARGLAVCIVEEKEKGKGGQEKGEERTYQGSKGGL